MSTKPNPHSPAAKARARMRWRRGSHSGGMRMNGALRRGFTDAIAILQ